MHTRRLAADESGDAELLASYKAYRDAYFTKRDLEATLSRVDPDTLGFGSSADEVAFGPGDLLGLYRRDFEQVPQSIQVSSSRLHAQRLAPDFGVVMEQFDLEVDTPEGKLRLPGLRGSYAMVRRGGAWKLAHVHVSEAMKAAAADESYPLAELKRRNEELEALVSMRTAELERVLSERNNLLKEVHHRIKNNMATVSSILSLNAGHVAESAAAALRDASGRVAGMMRLYDLLYRTESYRELSLKDYVEILAGGLEETVGVGRSVRLIRSVDDASLGVQSVFHLGIVINELVTNAYKYAFRGRPDGEVSILFKPLGGSGWLLEVSDDGLGFRGDPQDRAVGFGLGLVRIIADQLGAEFRMDRAPSGGARIRIQLGSA